MGFGMTVSWTGCGERELCFSLEVLCQDQGLLHPELFRDMCDGVETVGAI